MIDAVVQAMRGCTGTQITMLGQAGVVEPLPTSLDALPKSCKCVALEWADDETMGETAGLGSYPHIKRLSLIAFRCTEHTAQLTRCMPK